MTGPDIRKERPRIRRCPQAMSAGARERAKANEFDMDGGHTGVGDEIELATKAAGKTENKRFARTPGYLAGSPSSGASHEEDPPTCPCRPSHCHDHWLYHSHGPSVSHRMLVGSRPAGLRKTLSLGERKRAVS